MLCEKFSSLESVRNCLKQGVAPGLLTKSKNQYALSELLAEELFNRSVVRLRNKDMVEFAKLCSAFDSIEHVQKNSPFDRNDQHPLNSPINLSEALERGLYKDE